MNEVILWMKGITKQFPGVLALDHIDFLLEKGEIHGLIGENGAGKSTMMNILGGDYQPTEGSIELEGKSVRFENPKDSQDQGVSFIHQELSLFPKMDIATNLFMHELPHRGPMLKTKELKERTRQILNRVHLSQHSPNELVGSLQIGEQQMVEIARSLVKKTKILVLDEPTSSLTEREKDTLFELMRELKNQGVSIIFITHRMDEVYEICDRISILRDGKMVLTERIENITKEAVVHNMIGRRVDEIYNRKTIEPGKELLKVEGLSDERKFRDVSFTVHEREIVGLFGLMGSGRSEILRSIFGLDQLHKGQVFFEGAPVKIGNPIAAIQRGMGFVTEDRRGEGLMLSANVSKNLQLANLKRYRRHILTNERLERDDAQHFVEMLRIKTPSIYRAVRFLSGGNQQKVVIGKWINTHPKLLILDEPTRGIDIGSKNEIYEILTDLVEKGAGSLLVSSEIKELLGVCDRILVIRKGSIVAEYKRDEFSKEKLLADAMRV